MGLAAGHCRQFTHSWPASLGGCAVFLQGVPQQASFSWPRSLAAGGAGQANAEKNRMYPTKFEAEQRLDSLRSEFATLYGAQSREVMTNGSATRIAEIRDQIEVLKNHIARLDRFAPLLARCGAVER